MAPSYSTAINFTASAVKSTKLEQLVELALHYYNYSNSSHDYYNLSTVAKFATLGSSLPDFLVYLRYGQKNCTFGAVASIQIDSWITASNDGMDFLREKNQTMKLDSKQFC